MIQYTTTKENDMACRYRNRHQLGLFPQSIEDYAALTSRGPKSARPPPQQGRRGATPQNKMKTHGLRSPKE